MSEASHQTFSLAEARQGVVARVIAIASTIIPGKEITEDSDLSLLGMDSLELFDLWLHIEDEFDKTFEEEVILRSWTVREIVDQVTARLYPAESVRR